MAPGGSLLVIGHGGWPSWAVDHPHFDFPTLAEVLEALDLDDGWTVERCVSVASEAISPDGEPGTRSDDVLRVRRRLPT